MPTSASLAVFTIYHTKPNGPAAISFILLIDFLSILLSIDRGTLLTVSAQHRKLSFPLMISSVNVTKPAGKFGFSLIYWRNP